MLELFEFLIYDIVDTLLDILLLKVLFSSKKKDFIRRHFVFIVSGVKKCVQVIVIYFIKRSLSTLVNIRTA